MKNQKQILFRYTWLCMALVFLSSLSLFAQNLYVGGANASDNNPGTANAPFATIQKAATVAKAGDIINIRSGIYRETIIPTNSGTPGNPIVFQPDWDAVVTVSGADKADGSWTQYSGNIYRKSISMTKGYNAYMTNNTTLMANQVFVNGEMMIEARWPNLSGEDDLFDRYKFRNGRIGTWSTSLPLTLTDSAIPSITGGWTGGTIWMNLSWMSQTRNITGHSGNTLTLSGAIVSKQWWYYLTGRLGALDAEREFFYDGTYLYLWQPGGGSPVNVEVKKRNFAFDLRGKSNITINNIDIFAASVMTNPLSVKITLDGINAKYINHAVTLTDFLGIQWNADVIYSHTGQIINPEQSAGIRLMGANSIIRNSEVSFGSCMGIVLGENCTAINNRVHDINYEGNYGSLITPYKDANGQKILNNTMYRAGRSCIDAYNNQNMEIGYNDMYQFGVISNDMGCIYAARQSDLNGTRIHHNWFHDATPESFACAIYFEHGCKSSLIHHNVCWNLPFDELRLEQTMTPYHRVYNNTMASTGVWHSSIPYGGDYPETTKNNIYRGPLKWESTSGVVTDATPGEGDLTMETDPLFVGTGVGGLAYRLTAASPGRDIGVVIVGVTDDVTDGKPDAGAYEFGKEPWVPGYSGLYSIQVQFTDSASGEIIRGLEVNLINSDYITNDEGRIFLSDLTRGYYQIILPDIYYKIVGPGILYVRSDSLFIVRVRKLPLYSIQVEFTDSASGKPLTGMEVILGPDRYTTNMEGIITVPSIPEGVYSLVLPDSYLLLSGTGFIEVYSDSLFRVTVIKIPHLVLNVINRTSGSPVYRAAVNVNDAPYYSNSSGDIEVGEFPSGPFHVSVSHKDFFPFSDTLLFLGDTMIILSLTPKNAGVTFQVSDVTGPLSGVRVYMKSTQTTNSSGLAWFYNQPARMNYNFTISKAGYSTVQDTFYLETDTTLMVLLEKVVAINEADFPDLLIKPNPFDSYIHITLQEKAQLNLYDISGRMKLTMKLEEGLNTIPTAYLEKGFYMVEIVSSERAFKKVMVK